MLSNPIKDFTVGNTITIAVAIYRENIKKLFQLSLIAHLWLLVPVYGWGRYLAIAAWISKLSFNELAKDFHHLKYQQYVKIDSLSHLFTIAMSSIFIPVIVGNIVMMPLAIILPMIFKLILNFPSAIAFIENDNNFLLIGYFAFFLLFFVWIGIYARLFITDLTYGDYLTNERIYPSPINRSYSLTKNNTFKIYKIIWLSFLTSIPIYVLVFIVTFMISIIFYVMQPDKNYLLVFFFPTILFVSNGLLLPFWQSVKAVTFYQITSTTNEWSLR